MLTVSDVVTALKSADARTVIRLLHLGNFVLVGRIPEENEDQWTYRTGEGLPPIPMRDATSLRLDALVWPLVPQKTKAPKAGGGPQQLLLGRSRSNDVMVVHSSISKLHARLAVGDNNITVEDAGSRNGTFVNGRRLMDTKVTMESGDVLTAGSVLLTLLTTPALLGGARLIPLGR
jgi:hypothetical protein